MGINHYFLNFNLPPNFLSVVMFAARLERSSFCRSEAEAKKREWKTEKAALKII